MSRLAGGESIESPPRIADRLVRFIDVPPKFARIESTAAEGACLTLTLKPSDCFADLLAALRAVNLERRVAGDKRRTWRKREDSGAIWRP
jgi:hypothetical protein